MDGLISTLPLFAKDETQAQRASLCLSCIRFHDYDIVDCADLGATYTTERSNGLLVTVTCDQYQPMRGEE